MAAEAATMASSGEDFMSKRLYDAVARGKAIDFQEVLVEGANPNWSNPVDGRTPLHVAALHSRAAFVLSLLRAGANINATDARGRTALDLFLKWKTIGGCLFLRRASGYDCYGYLTQAHQVRTPPLTDICIGPPSRMCIDTLAT